MPPNASRLSSSFLDTVWNTFDAADALERLLSKSEAYFGERKILFAALGAWIVQPQDSVLRKAAIVRSVRGELVAIERKGLVNVETNPILADICARLPTPKIEQFFKQVYYPIGGLRTLTGKHSHPNFRRYYRGRSLGVLTAIEVAKIYHHHATYLAPTGQFLTASLNSAAPLVKQLNRRKKFYGGMAEDNVKKQWRSNRPAIALAYAAYSLPFKPGNKYSNLLDVFIDGDRQFHSPEKTIARLIDRAFFFERSILSLTYRNEGAGLDLQHLTLGGQQFEPHHFEVVEQSWIAAAFAKSKGRTKHTT